MLQIVPEPKPTELPQTRVSLAADFGALGLHPGMVLIVHSSLSSLGWVCGGPVTVVDALLDVIGPAGTLVVPTHSVENSDPADWVNPPVPESWWPIIREHMPAFDPARTPTTGMGRIPETARTWPTAIRSNHPRTSFAAIGANAELITGNHRLESQLGDESPLARIYDLDGHVLLLGVGHERNTSMHLAEYRIPNPPTIQNAAAIWSKDEGRQWLTWTEVDYDSDDFAEIGREFDPALRPATGQVGKARCVLARQRDVVDFAVEWMALHRGHSID